MTREEYEAERRLHRDKVCQLHKDGYGREEIADMTGYSKSYVDRIIRKIKGPSERRKMSEEQKRKALEMRKDGKKLREIAAEVGFSQSTVQKYIKNCGQEENEEAAGNELTATGKTLFSAIPSGTVITETIKERDGEERVVKWTLEKQYRYHACFKNKIGIRRCFTNAELLQRRVIHHRAI